MVLKNSVSICTQIEAHADLVKCYTTFFYEITVIVVVDMVEWYNLARLKDITNSVFILVMIG